MTQPNYLFIFCGIFWMITVWAIFRLLVEFNCHEDSEYIKRKQKKMLRVNMLKERYFKHKKDWWTKRNLSFLHGLWRTQFSSKYGWEEFIEIAFSGNLYLEK